MGLVPATIFNISTMKELSFNDNKLSEVFHCIDIGFPNLERLYLFRNNFSGTIPSSITNISNPVTLQLAGNSFSGYIPSKIGNLRSLSGSAYPIMTLKSSTPDLTFFSSLTSCKNLKVILVAANPINGILPRSLGNLSISLEMIIADDSNISGNIPEDIGNLEKLTR